MIKKVKPLHGNEHEIQMKAKYKDTLQRAFAFIAKSIDANTERQTQEFRLKAINEFEAMLNGIDLTEYLLLDSKPDLPKEQYIDSHFKLGTLYKSYIETEILTSKRTNVEFVVTPQQISVFRKALNSFFTILRVVFEDVNASQQIVSIFTQLCFYSQHDLRESLKYLQEALLYVPENETIHYNLGFIYQKLNQLELSLIHYRLSIASTKSKVGKDGKYSEEHRRLLLNNYNGISCIFRSIKQWPEALHYLLKAQAIDTKDPDIQNQLGVVYTEMRRTDLAEIAYTKAITNYKRTFISSDATLLLSELYLNFGHMHSYNGNNEKSVECYNKSLQISPSFSLPFQNKVMNLSYLFDRLDDKMFIYNQHRLVNKLYKKGNGKFVFPKSFYSTPKINIGIISGDFVDHPVSYFISTFLKNFDSTRFTVTCYSECIIDTSLFNTALQFKIIKNMSADEAARLIYTDNVHILFDLAGHTAFNRLDVFAQKPAPIQITYIGYPYSTGLDEMDYRITDAVCDDEQVSQPFYSEKLLFLDNCFLCYDPTVIKRNAVFKYPDLGPQPYLKNGKKWITIGCYNRVNKITERVVKVFNDVLLRIPNTRFVFKTKALLNKSVQKEFVNKFDKSVRDRITVNDCTLLHEQHLSEYNKIDIAIDTFPYSGTTTSCEALFMGVPVFAFYDTEYYFHPQNVTVSLLKNSHKELEHYVIDGDSSSSETLISKIKQLMERDESFWDTLKHTTRQQFLSGKVCDKQTYMHSINSLMESLVQKHASL